jgi:hypothetical protein
MIIEKKKPISAISDPLEMTVLKQLRSPVFEKRNSSMQHNLVISQDPISLK